MLENGLDSKFIQKQLSELVDYYSRPDIGKVEFWELLAKKLSVAMNRNEPWTWRYVQGVYRGTIAPSKDFAEAVLRLGALIDGAHELSVKTEVINVHVMPSTITPGSFVMGKSKICPRCTISFVPNVPWRKECPICSPPR